MILGELRISLWKRENIAKTSWRGRGKSEHVYWRQDEFCLLVIFYQSVGNYFFFSRESYSTKFTSTWNLMNKSGLLTFRSGSMAPTVKNLELSCWLSTTVTLYGSLWNCGGWSLMTWIVTTATPSFPLGSLAITSNCKIIHNGKYIHSFFFLF